MAVGTDSEWEQQLLHARLEAMAEFAAGAGHEINNPVATIVGRVQLLLRDETDPERRRALNTIGGQAYRIRDMIGDAMLFARPPEPEPVPLDLAEELSAAVASLHDAAREAQVVVGIESDRRVPVFADAVQLQVVITELLRNSIDASEKGGLVSASARAVAANDVTLARLVVADSGAGFTEVERTHLFDPFFSGRQAGRGLGFGLPKCWRIVTMHGGSITLDPEADETRFVVDLPAQADG